MIESFDISVIIQGPIYNDMTDNTVTNIRQFFPDAEIIVSTWEGSNYQHQLADVIIESKDPGGYPVWDNPKILNACNRQIVSTLAGLKKATRKYALKIRSDMYFDNINFLNYWDRFPQRCTEYKITKERILMSTRFAPNPHREAKPYHPSDWFFFGLREDLIDVFNSPLCPEPQTSRFFETHKRPIVKYENWVPALCQYSAEQYIWVAFLRRHIRLEFEHSVDIEHGNLEKSEHIFANNTVLLDAIDIGYNSYKHNNIHTHYEMFSMYSHFEWLKLYKKYCDKNYKLPLYDKEKVKRLYWSIRLRHSKKKILYNLNSLLGLSFRNTIIK